MRKIVIAIIAITLIIVACKSKKETIGSKYLNAENLTTQSFAVNISKDTVLKTMQGIRIKIDANSIEAATQTVTIEVKEALQMQDILQAGLTTQTQDGILSSDGMFNIKTKENSTIVKPLQIEVPTNAIDDKMQLYKGAEENGQIVWQEPKPLEAQPNKPNGKDLFFTKCASCHSVNKNLTGPALAWVENRWSDKNNLIAFIKNSGAFLKDNKQFEFDSIIPIASDSVLAISHIGVDSRDWGYAKFIYCENSKSNMTAFDEQLNNKQIEAILDYIAVESKSLPKSNYPSYYDSCTIYKKIYEELEAHKQSLLEESKQPMVNKNQTFVTPENTFIEDTTPLIVNNKVQPNQFDATYYTFNIDAYGWYNVDRLLNNKDYLESQLLVNIEKAETKRFQVYLVIPSLKILADGGLLNDKKNYGFYTPNGKINLPQGIEAYVFAVGEENNKTYFGLEHFTTSQNQIINLKVEETSKEKMLRKMKHLKFDDFKFSIDATKNYNEIKTVDEELKQIEMKTKGKCDCLNSNLVNKKTEFDAINAGMILPMESEPEFSKK